MMGWSNYLIVPEIKTAFEISRDINLELSREEVDDFLVERDEFFETLLYKKFNELSLKDYNSLIQGFKFGEEAYDVFVNHYDNLLAFYFIGKSKRAYIITEFTFDKDRKKYKDYKIVPRYLED